MTRREWYALIFLALVSIAFAVSVIVERRPTPTVQQAVAHERTRVAEVAAAKAETVYVHIRDSAFAGRAKLQPLRDSVLAHPSDTVLVPRYVARVDTLLRQDSTALATADSVIGRLHIVIAAKDTELVLARQPPSRFRTTVAALYDPTGARYSGSADASFRVIGGWALIARVSAPIGERPQAQFGVSLTLQ